MLYTIILFSSCNANRKLFSPNSIIYLIDYGKNIMQNVSSYVCTRMYTFLRKQNYHIVKNVHIRILSVSFFLSDFREKPRLPFQTNPIKISGLQSQGKRFAYAQCCTL